MKLLRTPQLKLILSLILGFTLVNCSGQKQSTQGPGDFGGGDVQLNPTTKKDILRQVQKIEKTRFNIFYALELFMEFSDKDSLKLEEEDRPVKLTPAQVEIVQKNLWPALEKIFVKKDGKNIYDYLETSKFRVAFDSPCRDGNGQPVDGSAHSPDQNEICLSAERLQSKLDRLNMTPAILGLAVHEFAHKMGATELEAQAIEFFAYMYPEGIVDGPLELETLLVTENLKSDIGEIRDAMKGAITYEELNGNYQGLHDEVTGTIQAREETLKRIEETEHSDLPEDRKEIIAKLKADVESLSKTIESATAPGKAVGHSVKYICSMMERLNFDPSEFMDFGHGVFFDGENLLTVFGITYQKIFMRNFCSSIGFEKHFRDQFGGKLIIKRDDLINSDDMEFEGGTPQFSPNVEIQRVMPADLPQLKNALDLMEAIVDKLIEARKRDVKRMNHTFPSYED